ncbi:hypothetical protein ACP275_10G129400 [Erythranthe tilingii]
MRLERVELLASSPLLPPTGSCSISDLQNCNNIKQKYEKKWLDTLEKNKQTNRCSNSIARATKITSSSGVESNILNLKNFNEIEGKMNLDFVGNSTLKTENVVGVNASSGKSQRSENFSRKEDVCIVSVWLNTRKDVINGENGFWRRIYDRFIINCGQGRRTERSIKNRWVAIKTQCAEFVDCLNQINSKHQSKQTNYDKVKEARALYAANNGDKPFKFEHCFDILKYEKKWLDTFAASKRINDSFVSISAKDTSESSKERPLIAKQSNVQLKRKRVVSKDRSLSTISLADKLWEAKIELKRKELILYEERLEMDIMSLDITRMMEPDATYWKMQKNEILRKNGII